MRVGLLTRFMGYVGIFAGVLILFVVTPVPVVQAYWLVALGYLVSGRWPSGLPPAWMSGRAEPWPSSQAQRDQRMRQRGAPRGQRPAPAGQPGAPFGGLFRKRAPAQPAPVPVEAPTGGTRATTPKRKRKRRK
jgi:hypothetical protein